MRLKCAVIGAAAGLRKALPEYLTEARESKEGRFSSAKRQPGGCRLAGKERRTFGKLLKKYGIDKRRYHS